MNTNNLYPSALKFSCTMYQNCFFVLIVMFATMFTPLNIHVVPFFLYSTLIYILICIIYLGRLCLFAIGTLICKITDVIHVICTTL